ncbi:MAG: 30S ribosomal protein S3 [Candidatus Portnoybacteria bacterium CG10_big_fil_rev_8_21_14_0_10_36_7]|uniref:Small ribosomal subunit protein uS3 n=1 Tax=Candidatus Portnoybacteria bacterium CG10_big_fil_rev_8_21_14_0_10_36_7 TaxID=1974812 RepID=A0A2M8KDF9_9BACT|nr:MAG: 30S ribosomal protein S3 [Candidatus Portnoybacteria bacterium CG10_big_fil_rev_8_21_14_0_10_36_7]
MGHKINPKLMRLTGLSDWQSRWFSAKEFPQFLEEDLLLREHLEKKLSKSGLAAIEIERSFNALKVIIKTSKPGLIIGRGGSGIEDIKKELTKLLKARFPQSKGYQINLEVEEIKNPQGQAMVMALNIAEQIEKRMPFRRTLKQTIEKISQSKDVLGVKIMIKGRLDGNEIARKEWLAKGQLPLHTLRANIDYVRATAFTTYGTIGIKVWIYKGERQ